MQGKTLPPQWINGDLRNLDVSVLGKFDVVVADPPWAIHQEVRFCPSLVPTNSSTDDVGELATVWDFDGFGDVADADWVDAG